MKVDSDYERRMQNALAQLGENAQRSDRANAPRPADVDHTRDPELSWRGWRYDRAQFPLEDAPAESLDLSEEDIKGDFAGKIIELKFRDADALERVKILDKVPSLEEGIALVQILRPDNFERISKLEEKIMSSFYRFNRDRSEPLSENERRRLEAGIKRKLRQLAAEGTSVGRVSRELEKIIGEKGKSLNTSIPGHIELIRRTLEEARLLIREKNPTLGAETIESRAIRLATT